MLSIVKRNVKLFLLRPSLLIFDLLCIIILLIVFYNNNFVSNDEIFYIISGSFNLNPTFLVISFSFLINFSYIYFTHYIYKYDINFNKESIFLRFSYKKWMISNICSDVIINILMLIMFYIIVMLYSAIANVNINISIFSILIVFLSKFLLQLIFIVLYKIFGRYTLVLMTILLTIPLVFKIPSLIYIYIYTALLIK